MRMFVLITLISTSAFAGLNRETCTTDKKDPVVNKETGVTETVTTTVCNSKYFTDEEIKEAVKKLEANKKVDNSKEKK